MKLKLKIIYLEWIDAKSTYGWHPISELSKEPFLVVTAGLLVCEDAEFITVSTSYAPNADWADPITIPKRCITKRKTLMVLK